MGLKRPWPHRLRRLLYWVLGIYAVILLAVFFWGERLVFFPEVDTEGDWTLPENAEEVRFGPGLHAWHLKHPDAKLTIIVSHGNAGNIAGRKSIYEQLRGLGVNLFAYDYRGYGKSTGHPTEQGVYDDGLAAWDYLVEAKGLSPNQIVLLGQSLGSAVATYVATKRECAGLILEAPMASAAHMAAKILPFPPVAWALRVELDNVGRIGKVRCPVLIVHGTDDGVIPFAQGKEVFDAANEPKRFVALEGGDHNDLWDGRTDDYMNAISDFLARSVN
jgi:uncharacterized protein